MLKTLSPLLREASLRPSWEQALALVLEWVVDRFHAHACALYARNAETDELALLACRDATRQESPPSGLASLVMEGFGPIRLERPCFVSIGTNDLTQYVLRRTERTST